MLKLYHWNRCGHSAIALLCLHAKGLSFESHYIDLLEFEQYSPPFLALSAAGQVPVLVHGTTVITQTTAIAEYLDETFPESPLMPADALGRWKTRVWAKILNEDVAPSVSMLGWHLYTRARLSSEQLMHLREATARIPTGERREVWNRACAADPPSDQLLYSRRKLEVVLARMEAQISREAWLAGAQASLADLELFPMIAPLAQILPDQLNSSATPYLLDWLNRMRRQPVVQRALGTPATDVAESVCFAPGPEHIRWG